MIQENLSDLTKKKTLVEIEDKAETRKLHLEQTGFGPTVEYEARQ
jgi:hypothetical protein